MEDLHAKLKSLQADEATTRAAYDNFLVNLSHESEEFTAEGAEKMRKKTSDGMPFLCIFSYFALW